MPRSSSAGSSPTKQKRVSTEKEAGFLRLQTTKFLKQRKLKATCILSYSQPTGHIQAGPWLHLMLGIALFQA